MQAFPGTGSGRAAAATMPGASAGRISTLLRSAAVTVTVIALSAAAHTAAGGTLPTPGIIAALGALLMLPARLLVSRQRPARVLTGILAAGQLLLHELFGLLPPQPGCSGRALQTGHHATGPVTICSPGSMPATHLQAGDDLPAALMLLAHLTAAAATAAMIARGESALRLAADFILRMFRLPAPSRLRPALQVPVAGCRTMTAESAVHRPDRPRGPPAYAVA